MIETIHQQHAQAEFRAFANKDIAPFASQFDQEERIPPKLVSKLARQGYFGALLPEEYDGTGMDIITYGLLNEELGKVCSSTRGLVMLQNMVARTIFKWGNAHQKQKWLKHIASGEVIAALALTESDAGSSLKSVSTSAHLENESFVLNGHKKWISFGQIANLFLVLAQHQGKLCAFLVERDTPGFSIHPISGMLGLRAAMLADLYLEDCQIPKENLVGTVGFGLMPVALFALNIGRYSIAWGCVGIAQACLEACIKHTQKREQSGVLLKEHQLIQQMITDMIVNIKAARLLCYQAGQLETAGDPKAVMETMIAKYFTSTMATKVTNDAVQIHGAAGCSQDHITQRHLRDAKIMEIIEGTTQIHQINIAQYGYQTFTTSL